VQECFLAFVRTPERYDPARGTVKTFLFSIARNLTLKHYRDHSAEDRFEEDNLPRPFDPRQSLDASAAVNAALAALPPLQREAIVLFELGGCTLQDIAHIVGADGGTVKSRLHRARARRRRTLAVYGRDLHGAVGK
jgi:RNA polymerase sigma-70 factor (ECF subfamily)